MTNPMAAVQDLLESGVRDGVFPAAQAFVLHRGAVAFLGRAGEATSRTVFDLASLTKVMCTTSVFLSLWQEGKVSPETALATFFPEAPASVAGVTLADLLYHRSGLPAFVPFFVDAMRDLPALREADCPASVRTEGRKRVVDAARRTPLEFPRGTRALYSDVGFILLGEALAMAGSASLDTLFDQRVAKPLHLRASFRRLSLPARGEADIAPTGRERPRPPAPGQQGLWSPFAPREGPVGEVDDDNAWALDGVAGHAGLFGTAADVARFGEAVLDGLGGDSRLANAALWQRAVQRDDSVPRSSRAMGFDTPSSEGSSAGQWLGSSSAVGHTGFTGVSLWVDRTRELSVALCTNRTALGRQALGIREFRPRFHDAVIEGLGLV